VHCYGRAALAALLCGAVSTLAGGCGSPAAAQDVYALHTEQARTAQSFVDSIGINVHLSYRDGPYGKYAAITPLLRNLGVRHLRDGITAGQTDVCREDRELAAAGMKFTYITQPDPTAQGLSAWASCVGPAIEAYEGLNEYDIMHPAGDTNWATTVQNAQKALYSSVKHDPSLAHLGVVAPSLTSQQAYRAVGDLSEFIDSGNMHDYTAGHNPGTTGWGAGGYGSLAYNIGAAQLLDGNKPIQSTETGYATAPATRGGIDAATQAKYVPRLFLEHFNSGVARTYEYELVDEGGGTFGNFGLVYGSLAPKPSYAALSGLIALLRDGDGSDRARHGNLRYALDGDTSSVHHTLLAKRDGRLYLVLWVEAPSYDSNTLAPLTVRPRDLVLRVAAPLRSATIYRYDGDPYLHPAALDPHQPRLSVSDQIIIVELVPARDSS
jgi:hypothetical protein